VEVEVTGVAMSAADIEGHDVPPEVLTSVVHWLRKRGVTGGPSVLDYLEAFRRAALEGAPYCDNDGCDGVGHLKDFKVCPQCKAARYLAMRARNRIGQRVGTRQRAAHPQVYKKSKHTRRHARQRKHHIGEEGDASACIRRHQAFPRFWYSAGSLFVCYYPTLGPSDFIA
jgi:hypothetical protein